MLGFHHIKGQPTTYLIKYQNGKATKEGTGISFWYFAPLTSIVAVPVASNDVPFIIKETTLDFQEVSVQGQVTYRINQPKLIAEMMDFTLDSSGKAYASSDPEKLSQKIINNIQVLVRAELHKIPLRDALKISESTVKNIISNLRTVESLKSIGIEILDLSILGIRPNPETSRALEAEAREQLLKEADQAIYDRRNSAVEQERAIKENELNTELAVENKKKQIREAQMDAEIAVQEKQQSMDLAHINAKIIQEEKNKELVELSANNAKVLSDSKAYDISATVKPLSELDPKVLQALLTSGLDSSQLIAQAFRGLTENADKIGQLNVTPDLLKLLIENK